ncbi:MAG: imidazole glycerol phosphate synthase subunit HisH [Planctomycetes bacterium]|nr:imidazole glycerol phosphate synthase subunit HisH [Planctomycetota bacterium]
MIVIVDYKAGNIKSVFNAFKKIGQDPVVSNSYQVLEEADAIVIPGVGAFGEGMKSLKEAGLIECLNEQVIGKKKPFLGICLGMQLLADCSLEMGEHEGLGWIGGTVKLIETGSTGLRVPHIGWNDVDFEKGNVLFDGFVEDPVFYFAHSYYFEVTNRDYVSSCCTHGITFSSSVQKDNIFGVQFHPEKSQSIGLKVLENFVKEAINSSGTCSG